MAELKQAFPARVEPKRLSTSPAALLQNWRAAYDRARAYLGALAIEPAERDGFARQAIEDSASVAGWPADAEAHGEALAALRAGLVGGSGAEVEARFLDWRLTRLVGRRADASIAMPPLARRSMLPHHIARRGLRRRLFTTRSPDPWSGRAIEIGPRIPRSVRARRLRERWVRIAFFRRALLLLFVSIPTIVASGFMLQVLPQQGRTYLELAIVAVFGTLFGWISIGFWTAIVGFFILLFRQDRFRITKDLERIDHEIDPRTKTAIVMAIREEPVEEVFSRLRAIDRSLERTGLAGAFEFHVLSDSNDPATWVREEEAWLDWCRETKGFGRIFYRRRRVHVKRKSGNIADFCRRYGRRYRYMVTLDADSLMTGEAIVALVRMMEEHPHVGLIQTLPVSIHARSLYARIQQFANRVYGPLFATGMHFWQLGDAQYWGHNAILRIAPFMIHCSLPRLPGKPPRGGEILSHDFVEAAMLGRAGYSIWLAYDLPGSYEELPSSLLEDLQRDRRWCQGNFQHLRLVFVEGLFHFHRALFLNGVLAYVSALLWFLFLSLSTAEAIVQVLVVPEYFPPEGQPTLFPQWPIWRPDWAYSLLAITMAILFVPKVLSAILVMTRGGGTRGFGGPVRFLASIALEFLASSLFAPVRMVFHTKFVLTNLLGRVVAWRSPPRGVHETKWGEAFRHHFGATLLASAWGIAVYRLNPDYFWWLTPIIGALILSVPVSVFMSRLALGDAVAHGKLFATPDELSPPREIIELASLVENASEKLSRLPPAERDGFVRGIVDPWVNAVHRWLLRGPRSLRPSIREARRRLVERALALGPSALSVKERRAVLVDPECVSELHHRVWALPSVERARAWGRPGMPIAEGPA